MKPSLILVFACLQASFCQQTNLFELLHSLSYNNYHQNSYNYNRFPQATQINYEGSNHRQSNYDGTPEGSFLQMNKNTNISTQNNYLRNGGYAKQLNLDSHGIQNNQIEHGMAEQLSIYSNGTSIRKTVGRWKFYGK